LIEVKKTENHGKYRYPLVHATTAGGIPL